MDFEEKVISSKPVYKGPIAQVEEQQVKLPNGKLASREIIHHCKSVAMLAITSGNKMIMEKQWRAPAKRVMLEIPAGKLDDRDDDSPIHAVKRELNEEVRFNAKDIKQLYSFYPSVGISDEYMYLYLVQGLTPVKNKLPRDPGEFLEIDEYSLDEAKQMLKDGQIIDAKTIMAIQYWELMQK
ncbi:NUDIX hydrolase [Fructilactobacillus fructivorans]|uniref:ADP-ribose pyrophosphatase n=1 Tax=Fructilactobacillus fructivorans TaxID=1614 RepID=A0A0C1M523_9LACO|nr:NUDIX hydrolase [Fructilactobacillus fructivorans]KID41294.1 ADP-ribose pyrophosphatase [Fructilactobacillus fructivorans]KRK58814.1 NUDIX hydrolase [Fructilactobacillus fructivorans]KRN13725.1 NUDIX hydrolase [Fructilactobacillus fructivorans]KRN39573.1 NUDIX hydrolase [Fructilactobacillus fructivorans]KRN43292.1 NUDIX hydrolase [Fructilactobacillus fructivorans]